MEYTKQPITLAEQINILKQRGLIFEDEEQAIAVLNHISYFRLASYWRVMEEKSQFPHRPSLSATLLHCLLAQQHQSPEHLRSGLQIALEQIPNGAALHDGFSPWVGE